MPKKDHIREVSASDPSEKHPLVFKLKDLVDDPNPETELEAHIEWNPGTWGTRVPSVIIKATKKT